ncbi:hypothetical protein ACFY1P_08045 [Streptomyces sp. NPDC001407]|uniref:hypothetical protein n=1 Tax=Streptomyces sp. NPDC001407 TaxID=3364573 RepID=UPI0036AFED35
MFEKGSRVRNRRYGYTGTLEKRIGSDRWIVYADPKEPLVQDERTLPGIPVEADEHNLEPLDFIDVASVVGESRETRAVMLYLRKEIHMGHALMDSLSLSSLESFTKDARRVLGDATEVTGKELDGADWEAIYEAVKAER